MSLPILGRRLAAVLATLWAATGAAAAQLTAPPPGIPHARALVSPALQPGAEPFEPATVCATFSVPLAQGWDVGLVGGRPALSLVGASAWSFRALDTWPDGALKWALCEAIVTSGKGLPPVEFYVTQGVGDSGQPDLAQQGPTQITIDTGPLEAAVSRTSFQLFHSVTVDGTPIVPPGSNSGIVATTLGGAVLRVADATQVSLESNGPVKCVVRADGTLDLADGTPAADFTCRLAFVRGSRDVEITFTLRNASIERPKHVQLESIDLAVRAGVGATPRASFATPQGPIDTALGPQSWAWAYQAYSTAPTTITSGFTPNYLPHLPKLDANTYAQEGYSVEHDGQVLWSGDKTVWPTCAWADLSGGAGGVTVAIRQMPYLWPASLQCGGDGVVSAGIFPRQNVAPYTWVWRQHESRTAVFSFHSGPAVDPVEVSRRLETPVVGCLDDYRLYEVTRVLAPYDLVTVDEQEQVYAALGVPHQVQADSAPLQVTRFLPASTGGGANNHDSILRELACEYLRFGTGGAWKSALDLALYKSEWQVLRSDDFHDAQDPGAQNDDLPHSKAFASDDEHRYREGLALAYWLSGDVRIREALYDEAEILSGIYLWPQERGMYQTMRAMASVATFTHQEAVLDPILRARLAYFTAPELDVDVQSSGWGWDGPPGQGSRGYFVYDAQHVSEKPPGEAFVSRGFVSGSMGPSALFAASEHLGKLDPVGLTAQLRLLDLATYTRGELFPWFADPSDRHLVYSYGVQQQQVNEWEQWHFHPIQLGMAEAWRMTGQATYLQKGVEQVEAFAAHGNLELLDHRIEFQHFCRAVLDFLGG